MVTSKNIKKLTKPKVKIITNESDIVEARTEVINTLDVKKELLTNLSFKHIEDRLRLGGKDANVLAKMIVEPHYPKVKLSITANIDNLDRKGLIGHMKGLVDGK